MIKQSLLAIAILGTSLMSSAQVPKALVGTKLYNADLWKLNPRFGGIPTIHFTSSKVAHVKRGDVIEVSKVSKFKNKLIIQGDHTKNMDTLSFAINLSSIKKNSGVEAKDQLGQLWTTRFSKTTEAKILEPFPAAKEGIVRNVIQLPEMKDEENYKIEIYAGINKDVDCNSYMMMGEIVDKNLDGYGYTYYEVHTEERIMGTLKGCLDGKRTKKFVHTVPKTIAYNSRLPLVIYAPKDVQLRYKVYSTPSVWHFATPQ